MHSFDETADLDKIAIRTKLAAVFLMRLSGGRLRADEAGFPLSTGG